MELKGLIPAEQKETELALPYWEYGTIENNKKKIDPLLHYGCFVLGFNRQDIIDDVSEQLKKIKPEIAEFVNPTGEIPRLNHVSYKLADKIYNLSEGYRSFYALSGSDANEGAVKLASAYHKEKNNKHKDTIISFKNSYHGSTFLTANLGADNLMEDPFYIMPKYHGVKRIDRDFDYASQDWDNVSCIVVETCSYGNNMTPNSNEFWNKLTRIQQEHDVILIMDDIFMGGGKTGNYIGWKHLPIKPDISTMGKAITAGTFPLSMVLYNEKIHNALPKNFKWDHGFTYNFSIPGILSALKYLDILEQEKILDQHDEIVTQAEQIIKVSGFEIVNRFGLLFMIRKNEYQMMYIIPVNASAEYFNTLKHNLSEIT
jgi:adenosylmethionine-8-amino-7-oxononanoate aminotransferase